MPDSRSYVDINREHWTAANKLHTDQAARSAWTGKTISWGQWHIEESEVRALPDVAGKDVIELGCGTAYFGAWLKQRAPSE